MQVNLPKPAFCYGEQEHLVFSSYLYMESLISALQCFLFLFSQCYTTIHPHSASVPNNKSPLRSFCLQDNQMSVSYSGSQPHCHIVLTCSLSLPLSAPCYLWKAKLLEYREVAWRSALPAAKRCNHCQDFDRKHSVTSAMPPPPLCSISPTFPTWLTLLFWGWRDECCGPYGDIRKHTFFYISHICRNLSEHLFI